VAKLSEIKGAAREIGRKGGFEDHEVQQEIANREICKVNRIPPVVNESIV